MLLTQNRFFILFFFIFSTKFVLAQNFVTGIVINRQTKEALVGAVVSNLEETVQVVTDADGKFIFKTSSEQIIISLIGYKTFYAIPLKDSILIIKLEPSEENLQSVVVSANREASSRITSPIAISKLSAKLLDETKATSLYEVLNKTPGVLVANQGNEQTQMSIRQPMSLNALFLYLEDGLPIRPLGIFQANALVEINQAAIQSIEVIRGPASSIYGAEAVGGAVNFISQRPTAVPSGKIGVQFDQFGYQRVNYGGGVTINSNSQNLKNKKDSPNSSNSNNSSFGFTFGGFVSKQRNSWLANSDYDKQAQYARAEYTFNPKTKLIGTVNYVNYNSSTSGSIDSVAFYSRQYLSTTDFTYRKSFAWRVRLTLEQKWNDNAQTTVTGFFRNNNISQNPAYAISWQTGAATANGQINSNSFKSVGLVVQHSQKFEFKPRRFEKPTRLTLITGVSIDESPNDYNAYRVELAAQLRADKKSVEKYTILRERPDIKLSDYNAQIHNEAVYAQLNLVGFGNLRGLNLSLGARYDRMAFDYNNNLDSTTGSKQFQSFSPKLGLTYEIAPNIGLYANIAKGFSPPALSAIFLKRTTPAVNGDKYYFNLEPATFVNYEIGGWAALAKNKIYLDFAIYQLNGTNELLNIRQPDNSFDYQSVGRTEHKGIELSATYKPSAEFFFRFGGTYAVHKFLEFELSTKATDPIKNVNGNDMPSAPHFVWNTEFSFYPTFLKDFRASIEWQHVAGWYQNQINTVSYDGYDLLNLRLGYKFHGFEVFTNVLNLTDALYATQATRGNNATDRSSYYASAPRTFMVGVQYSF